MSFTIFIVGCLLLFINVFFCVQSLKQDKKAKTQLGIFFSVAIMIVFMISREFSPKLTLTALVTSIVIIGLVLSYRRNLK
jgi:hypothetical protein